MAILRQCFPQCDICEKTNIDIWAYTTKLALSNALRNGWKIIDQKLCCPECVNKLKGNADGLPGNKR